MRSYFPNHKLIVLSIISIAFLAFSNEYNTSYSNSIDFKKISLNEGLSQISVLRMLEDDLGRMWFSTRNGINCWDGKHMKTFYSSVNNDSTILNATSYIECIYNGFLWIRSKNGVTKLNLQTQEIERFTASSPHKLFVYKDKLFLSTTEGTFLFNNSSNVFDSLNIFMSNGVIPTAIHSINSDEDIIGCQNGEIFRVKNNEFYKIKTNNNKIVTSIVVDDEDNLIVGTNGNGLILFNQFHELLSDIKVNGKFNVPSIFIRDIIKDFKGNIWFGTYEGLFKYDKVDERTYTYKHDPNIPGSISNNSIYDLHLDKKGVLWISTYFGGVNYFSINKQTFTIYSNKAPLYKPSHHVVRKMIEDEDNNLWIATEGAGIEFLNSKTGIFQNISNLQGNEPLLNVNIMSTFLFNKTILLISTNKNGIITLDTQTKKVINIIRPNDSISFEGMGNFIPYRKDVLVSTRQGIYKFDVINNSLNSFQNNKNLNSILENKLMNIYIDSYNTLWMGTDGNGLYSYNFSNKKIRHYTNNANDPNSIGYNTIYNIKEDSKQRLWFSTFGGGLCLYNRNKDNFSVFTKKEHNLPSDIIQGWQESRFGNIWVSTSRGLSRFDVENNQFYHYDVNSGFPLKELNINSILLTKDGTLYVGGVDGLTSFTEKNIVGTENDKQIVLSDLIIDNEVISTYTQKAKLTKHVSFADSIMILPGYTDFTIKFSTCNYSNVIKNKYQYKLEGFHDEWINNEYKAFASFMNISPGEYTFKVRTADIAYKTFSAEKTLYIKIKPYYYETKAAFILYIIVFLLIIYGLNRLYINKRTLAKHLELEKVENERIKDTNDFKLRFFTNISHEYLTPITLITGTLESIIDNGKIPESVKIKLSRVYRNTLRLKKLTTELLEFRKLNQGKLQLKVEERNIVAFTQEIYSVFVDRAEQKGIHFNFDSNIEHQSLWFDPWQMEKVFFNLLSNALKNAPKEKGKILISIINEIDQVKILVNNNGRVIPEDELNKIFDRFFQNSSFGGSEGFGIGLALTYSLIQAHEGNITCESKENIGTTFIVTLKKGFQHINPDWLINISSVDTHLINTENYNILASENIGHVEKSKDKKELKMLIVDDNEDVLELLTDIFSDLFELKAATDGEAGFKTAMEFQPDIIISDIMMPKLNGTDMCIKLKNNINTSHIPIILLTALATEEERIKNFNTGADEYITKPFNPKLLKVRIDNIFKNRGALQKNMQFKMDEKINSNILSTIDQVFINKAKKIATEHFTDPNFSIDSFANLMGQSRTVFYNKIKSITGQTPNDFIQTMKLNKAGEMLLNNTDMNVAQISYDLGFSTPNYFSLCFKKHFGVTPTKYGR